jgi:hypothetical protein
MLSGINSGLTRRDRYALLVILLPAFTLAQNTNSGEIRGTVTDPTGASVPEVTVTILNTDTGVTKDLTTNNAGIYDAVSILPGNYQLTFVKPGFEKLVRTGVTLTVGTTTVDAQLTVGATQSEVEVTAEAPLLQTENGQQSTTLEAQTMQQLPNVNQSWSNFTKLLPGAAGSGTGVSVNGNMPYYNNFLADGANVMLPHSANFDQMVFEDVAEVQMNTSTFSAEYGVGGAVFNQISKGGSNDWHGSIYEYFQNDALNARNFFSATVPFLRFNNFGGTISGPILKNKFFFFFNVDKTINNSSGVYTNTFPTAAMRSGDFSDLSEWPTIYQPGTLGQGPNAGRVPFPGNKIPASMLDPLALKFQSLFPQPNLPGYSNNWVGTLESPSPFLKWFGRLDYNLSDKNRITFSITQSDNPAFYPQPYPIGNQSGDVDRYNTQVSDVYTLSPNTVNEFRLGFTRQGNWFEPTTLNQNIPQSLGWNYAEANLPPTLQFDGNPGTTWIGPSTNAIYVENAFDTADVVTMIRGRHILKFGGEILAYQDNSTPWGNINPGTFLFSGAFTQQAPSGSGGLGYADFLLGDVASWNASNTPIVGFREKVPQFFIQDDFKITPTLTVNLGLRYQIQQGWHEVANRIGNFDPTITNPATNTLGAMWFGGQDGRTNLENTIYDIFLPRVGFAWSPKSNWVFRGGFGIYDGPWSLDTYAGGAEGLGTNSHGSLTSTDQIHPVFVLSQATPASLNYVGPSRAADSFNGQNPPYYLQNTPILKQYQWSFSIQRQFGGGMMAEAAYVGNHGTNLSFPADTNQVPANLLLQSVANPSNAQNLRPFPQFSSFNGNGYNAISNYDALQLSLTKRFSHGLQFNVNYTWSKMLDEQDSSGWGSRAGNQFYQDAYNPKLNYALSNFDIPNMFKGDLVYDLPFGKGRAFLNSNGFVDAFLGGWQIGTTFVFESGFPFNPVVGATSQSGTLSGGSSGGSLYPNLIGNPNISNPSVGQWFNTCTTLLDGTNFPVGCTNPAWAVPAPGHFGNAGRNILWGPGIQDVDFSLGKNFRFPLPHETGNLQIRFDALNGLNHPNFDLPGNSIGTSGAGMITGTTGNYNSTNNNFGQRILQLGARFSF